MQKAENQCILTLAPGPGLRGKVMREFDVAQGREGIVVYSTGTLYGAWPDGTPFDGNRYVDRFVVEGGKITKMDVWNDSAERLLIRNGIKA